ncbi:hypothetical protein RvY_14382-2 [Ramazzottius varieornatus]|uniref:Uncharacterized protein n=1 Tax=Ramazzottius varieornatus TaxID=947166 RepID=A0A1D1VSU2_RAMVA|nr:hypothetical protein RvY_14382-2 [Ramazzottius varieornatus]
MASWKTPPFISDVHHDQRSSTPKSSHGVPYEHLFAANESDILENGSPASLSDPQQPPKPSVKRKLDFDENSSFRRKARQLENRMAGPSMTVDEGFPRGPCDVLQPLLTDMVVLDDPAPVPEDQDAAPWTSAHKRAFYEAVQECGLDFPTIVECMKRRLQKSLGKYARGKSLQAVQKYFLGVIKEVTDILETKDSSEAFLTYAVVNFGAWIDMVPGPRNKDRDIYFGALFRSGSANFTDTPPKERSAGFISLEASRKYYIRTPSCPALNRLHLSEDFARLPSVVQVRLRPRSAVSWFNVQRSGRSPLLSIALPQSSTMKFLADLLQRHWWIERTERRYLNSEIPEFTVRPVLPLDGLHWPTAMPDFGLFLNMKPQPCWSTFDRYAKMYPYHEALRRPLKNPVKEVLCPDTFDRENLYYCDDAMQEEPEQSDEDDLDSTVVEKTNNNGYNPRVLYKEYFDERGNVVWSSAKHGYVSIAEIYLIAGRDSILLLDYDWIIPEEETYTVPTNLFDREDFSEKFHRLLQIKPPPASEVSRTQAREHVDTFKNSPRKVAVQQVAQYTPQKQLRRSPQKSVSFGGEVHQPHFDMISPSPTFAQPSEVPAISSEVTLETTVTHQEVAMSHESTEVLYQYIKTHLSTSALTPSASSPVPTMALDGQNNNQNSPQCMFGQNELGELVYLVPVMAVDPAAAAAQSFLNEFIVVNQGQAASQAQNTTYPTSTSAVQPPRNARKKADVPKPAKPASRSGRPRNADTSNCRITPSGTSVLKTILPKSQR